MIIAFMQAKGKLLFQPCSISLLGKALERLGIDADAAREAIKGLWERFKEFLPTLARWGAWLFVAIRACLVSPKQ